MLLKLYVRVEGGMAGGEERDMQPRRAKGRCGEQTAALWTPFFLHAIRDLLQSRP